MKAIINEYKQNIDKQIKYNKSKNLFHQRRKDIFHFIPTTISNINKIKNIDSREIEQLIEYTTQNVLLEFCRINQYISFNEKEKQGLKVIYKTLFADICKTDTYITAISEKHYERLQHWLKKSNPFIQDIYPQRESILQPVACSEYNVELQIVLLHLDISNIAEPILDIGCGQHAYLVNYLRNKGLDIYGIDRFTPNSFYMQNADWLEYNYGVNKWGTIISNLAFSNHFHNHHLRKDGNYIGYARKYMEILKSLKAGGPLHYAPDLPFIEQFLEKEKYHITHYDINNLDFKTTLIKRMT